MRFISLSKGLIFCCFYSLCCLHEVSADTIYQWTDPWGQIRYSKTQVPGSMVSELTELPETQEFTEQQKQEAMLRKMQQMNDDSTLLRQKRHAEKLLKQQNKRNESHCRKLRNMLADVKLRNIRRYYPDIYYFPGAHYYQGRRYSPGRYYDYRYDFLEQDLEREIRKYCR